jgi:hypothetical protein
VAERLIGSIRSECLDHIVVFGDAHLRRVIAAYTGYYNELRTHKVDGRTFGPQTGWQPVCAREIEAGRRQAFVLAVTG